MGGTALGGKSPSDVSSHYSYSDIFEKWCPYYLSWGMSLKDYWEGDPKLATYYRKAHELKNREINEQMWVQGIYFAHSISATVGNMFKKKGSTKVEYLSEPIPMNSLELQERREREQKMKMERMKNRMISRSLEINARIKGGG